MTDSDNDSMATIYAMQAVEELILSKIDAGQYTFETDYAEHPTYDFLRNELERQAAGKAPTYRGSAWFRRYSTPLWATHNAQMDEVLVDGAAFDSFKSGNTIVFVPMLGDGCHDCGAGFTVRARIDGEILKMLVTSKEKCAKNREYSVEVDFPSGEVVVGDWLPFFSELEDKEVITRIGADLCYAEGIRAESEHAAKNGYAFFFVGNTCPSIWREGENLRVGSLPEDEQEISIGCVCTDLWWTTMIDVERYKELLTAIGQTYSEELVKSMNVIKVEPGRYRIKPYYGLGYEGGPGGADDTYDYNKRVAYATIDKIWEWSS